MQINPLNLLTFKGVRNVDSKTPFATTPEILASDGGLSEKRIGAKQASKLNKAQTYVNFKPIIKDGLKRLDKENVVLTIHGGSFPSAYKTDTGFGSPNSRGARELIDFASGVFTGIQFGPGGITKASDSSPYTSTLFSSNTLFIDLEQLTEDKFGKILPKKEFNKVVANNKNYNKAQTNYSYIHKAQDEALKIAYNNFISSNSPEVEELKEKFEDYKAADSNSPWLDNDALYEALSIENGNDYWPLWDNELDKNLIAKKNSPQGRQRINQIRTKYSDDIDFYKFKQFILSEQAAETKAYANSKGLKLYADKQVAFSDRDVWAYQDLFLDGWKLGCPPDFFSKTGQDWGFPVLDPEKLFNEDGSLAKGGEILKKCFTKIFNEYDALRIDHFLGLVDPWVYPEGQLPMQENGAGRLYSSPFNEKLKKYSIISEENVDASKKENASWQESDYVDSESLTDEQIEKYSMYVEKIILAAARDSITNGGKLEKALKETIATTDDPKVAAKAQNKLDEIDKKIKSSLIAEDLGAVTSPMTAVMKKLGLNGIKVSQFMNPQDENSAYLPTSFNESNASYWYIPGGHDTKPVSLWAKEMIEKAQDGDKEAINHIEYIANYVYGSNDDYEAKKEQMLNDYKALMEAEYIMVMKSPAKNVQIFFADLFGDERVYNTPGTMPEFNWKTRVENNFMRQYNEALSKNKAFDFPRCTKEAIKSRLNDAK